MKTLNQLLCEKRSLMIRLEGAITEEEVKKVEEELEENAKAIEEEEKRMAQLEKDNLELRSKLYGQFTPAYKTKQDETENEKRAQEFAKTEKMVISNGEARSAILASGTLRPVQVGGINEGFNNVSSIIDLVSAEDLSGMGEYKEAYVATKSTASKGTEGTVPTESEPVFKTVSLKPQTISTIAYISKNIRKQTPLNYEAKVRKLALNALRKKVQEYVTKNNEAGMYGLINAVNTDGESMNTKLPIGAIDETTLRKIVFSYGGEEGIEGQAILLLNKNDLIAFGDVRGTNEKKAVYEIIPDGSNPNMGVIKDGGLSVRYCIDSELSSHKALHEAKTTSTKTMAYGNVGNYKLGLWGNYEVTVDEGYKFGEGLLTIRGEVEVGGNVTIPNGFVVVETLATIE